MFLKECLIENVGPVGFLDLSFPFNSNGTPKPVVLVGQNGSGKTIVISHIVDALIEFAKVAFSDIVAGQNRLESPFFKLLGGLNHSAGSAFGIALLDFIEGDSTFSYIDKSGIILPDDMKEKLRGRFSAVSAWSSDQQKVVHPQNKAALENFFDKSSVCYFPSSRHEQPHWLNRESADDKPPYGFPGKISGRLNKPIVVESTLPENRRWLLDVVLDSMVDFESSQSPVVVSAGGPNQISPLFTITSNIADKSLLKGSRHNINRLLSHILQNQSAKVVVGYRSVPNRLSISLGGNRVIPSLDHLSAGQAVLFNLFATIIRYSDRFNVLKSVTLEDIDGIVIIDEIDAHLHTDMQFNVLPKLLHLFPKIQFIVTSHSPMFLLGMEDEYGPDGFLIIDMPKGIPITTERFSEFLKSFDYFRQTQTFEDELRLALLTSNKPIVFTEGQTDPVFIRTALELLGRRDLLDSMDIRCVGRQAPQGPVGTGTSGLNHTRNVVESHSDLMNRKVLLLYDCDSNKPKEDIGLLSIRRIPKNQSNSKIRRGIENLFPEHLFGKQFYEPKRSVGEYGEEKNNEEFRKSAFCRFICEERKEATDFAGFGVVIDLLVDFLGVDQKDSKS